MSRKLKLILGLVGLAVLIVGTTFAYNALRTGYRDTRIAFPPEVPNDEENWREPAPDFAMLDWDGNSLKLSDIIVEGKPIILNFWASWCPPCKYEMPDFDKVHREFGDRVNFVMLDLVDGQRETEELGRRYVLDNGFDMPIFFDVMQEGAFAYGIHSIPTTIFIDNEGYVITGVQGAIDEEILRGAIGFILN